MLRDGPEEIFVEFLNNVLGQLPGMGQENVSSINQTHSDEDEEVKEDIEQFLLQRTLSNNTYLSSLENNDQI